MDYGEGVDCAFAAALDPGNVLALVAGAEVPGVEKDLVAFVALAKPQFVGLGLLPVEIGLGLWDGTGSWYAAISITSFEVTRYLLVGGQDYGAGGRTGCLRCH